MPRCRGGAAFLVQKNIKCSQVESPKQYNSFEHIIIQVVFQEVTLNTVCINRPPGTNTSFLDDFSDLNCHLNSLKHTFVIVDDINIDPKSHIL